MKKVAIVVQNIIQWYSLKPLAELLEKQKDISVDIVVYKAENADEGFLSIANSLFNLIKKTNFRTLWISSSMSYDMTLAPYSDMIIFKSKYRIGYCYGAASTKPSQTLRPEFKNNFHAFMLHDTYGAELHSVYAKTYIVPDLYLRKSKHKKTSDKPVVLFLPTYHEDSTIDTVKALAELKDRYYIIIKSHHGTEKLTDEKQKNISLQSIADEYYTSEQYVGNLFDKADVVLSDNSGAAMDALYIKIPVAISVRNFSPSISGIAPIQQVLANAGVIPYTNQITAKSLDSTLKKALSAKQKSIQAKASDKLFPQKTGGAKAWYVILKRYLYGEAEQNYCKFHDYYVNQILKDREEKLELSVRFSSLNDLFKESQDTNKILESKILKYEKELSYYHTSKIHRIAENISKRVHYKQR